ncbi:MAG TPA: lysylphosphatidylglycerol synthase domain-containing protein [Chitinophagaceae bacterium]
MKLNRNIKRFINYFLGPLLFLWLSWSIYRHIQHQPNLGKAWQRIRESFSSPLIWNLVMVVVLMVVNWSIEAFKWKISIKSVQQISFLRAFKAILSGVSFSVSTPNRVGEYLGRVLYMEEGNRLRTISITIVGSISQLIITLFMGCLGLLVLRSALQESSLVSAIWMQVILYGVLACLIVLTLFYFRLAWLIRWIDRLPGSSRFAYLVRALEDFDATILLRLLSLSALRFIVFILQYYLLFRLFDVNISWWQAFWAVSVSFLVMAIIPTFAIAELGLRGEISIKLIGLFSVNNLGILMTSMTIWLVNLILPAVIGSLLILSIRTIFTNKSNHENSNGKKKLET